MQFVASFSLLVFIHELGHFMFARMFGIRVEKFYLFFDPWFSLFKFNYKGTEFGIGWVPFGGYCKIAGMVDESMDTESLQSEPKPDEFRSKPAWQRLLVMVGGVMMNVLLAMFIYIGMCFAWGERYLPNDELTGGSVFNELAHNIGFQDGDRVVSVGGEHIEDYSDVYLTMLIEMAPEVEVLRGGEPATVCIDDKFRPQMTESRDFMAPRIPFQVGAVDKAGGAHAAGIEAGDRIVGIDTLRLEWFDQFQPLLTAASGTQVSLTVDRAGKLMTMPVSVSGSGKIGVGLADVLPYKTHEYNFFQSIPAGIKKTGDQLSGYWKQLGMIVSPKTEAYKSVGGVLAIGNLFPSEWNWAHFWYITAFISIALAVLNILPLPVLDGGHVVFLMYEVITRRKPSDKFLEYALTVGMILLLAVLVLANGNDIYRLFIK